MEIIIGSPAEIAGTTGSPISGFFGMGENLAFGLVILIVVLLLAIALTGLVVSKQEKTLLIEKMGVKR